MKNMIILVFCLLFETITAMIPENPRVTVSIPCRNHGLLTVRAEIVQRANGFVQLLDGTEPVRVLATEINGAVTNTRYGTDDAEIILRKTVMQNGIPWIRPSCYLVPALLNPKNDIGIIRALLTAVNDGEIPLEDGGTAHLYINPQGGE